MRIMPLTHAQRLYTAHTCSCSFSVVCRFYVTPKSFLDMLGLFSKMLEEQHSQLTGSRERLLNGLAKLNDTNAAVDGMQQQLNLLQPTLVQKTASAEQLLAQVLVLPKPGCAWL